MTPLQNPSFYSIIIGTEILNGRRADKHFEFLNAQLLKRGWEQKANFVIKDDPIFIAEVFELVKKDPNGVMFCFGGIGATPDDYTREVAAKVFRGGAIETNSEALTLIVEQFGEAAYPFRVNMAKLPVNAGLLKNIVNNVPGFFLDGRYFFTPGFPSMSQAMVLEALDRFYPVGKKKYESKFIVFCPENDMIETMNALPKELDFSSLPRFVGDKREVEIRIAGFDKKQTFQWADFYKNELIKKNIQFQDLGE